MKKLSKDYLRNLILEEMTRLEEEREVEAIMKRVLGEDSGREEGDRYRYNAAADRYDMQHDIESGDSRKHLDNLAKDIRYDDEHIDDDGDDHHHHDHDGHNEGRKLDEDAVEEVVSYQDADDDATAVATIQADTKLDTDPSQSIGESTITNKTIDHDKYLSRGALYRKRYYGRY